MRTHWIRRAFRLQRVFSLLTLSAALAVDAAETAAPAEPDVKPTNEATNEAQQAWRSYLQLQDQLRSAMLSLEQGRKESEANNRRNAEALAGRLAALEQTITNQRIFEQALASQRERDLETMQSANRVLLVVAGVFATLGFLTMFFTVWLQMRALTRLTEIASLHRDALALGPTPLPALGSGDAVPAALTPAEASSKRLLGVLEQLEKRLQELEHAALPAGAALNPPGKPNGESKEQDGEPSAGLAAEPQPHLNPLVGKGQSLLNLGQVEQAMACFDEVIAAEPNHAEALMKKGLALERLQKLQEALECYDRAIAADDSLTLAYVYKGGVYNQLEKYDEALECYEKALRAQQKHQPEIALAGSPA